MNRRSKYRLVIYIILLLVLLIAAWLRSRKRQVPEPGNNQNNVRVTVNRDRGFDRRTSFIEYTKHARCRMSCRQISVAEVEEIMKNGSINYRKSDLRAKPCPEYAVEGITSPDDQHVRIIFAQCEQKTKVVTCIDLDHEFDCSCN